MEKLINILICSAGRRVALVKAFQEQSVNLIDGKAKVFTTDLNPLYSVACNKADGAITVGKFAETDYIERLIEHCLSNNIKVVIPTIDSELLILASNATRFAEHDIEVVVSDLPLVTIFRDKRKTNQFFETHGFKTPKELDKNNLEFPAFVKPIDGSNSKSLYLLEDESMVFPKLLQRDDLMFMEYLPKSKFTEYSVDMYYDRNGNLCCLVPRIRLEIRGGEVSKSITQKNTLILFLRERLGKIEGARGCLTLQCFLGKEHGDVYGIEINPRFGGGFPLSYRAGANYPGWIIEEYIQQKSIPYYWEGWEKNLLLLRYDEDITISDVEIPG